MPTILLATTKLSKDHSTPDESTRKKTPFFVSFLGEQKRKITICRLRIVFQRMTNGH
jgi:hypothetical protein